MSTHSPRFFVFLCLLAIVLCCSGSGEPDAADGEATPPAIGSTSAPVSEAERSQWRQEVIAVAASIDAAWKRLKDSKPRYGPGQGRWRYEIMGGIRHLS